MNQHSRAKKNSSKTCSCSSNTDKFRVKLDVSTYQATGNKVQIFPPKEGRDSYQAAVIRQGEAKFKDYDASMDLKSRIIHTKKTADLGLTVK